MKITTCDLCNKEIEWENSVCVLSYKIDRLDACEECFNKYAWELIEKSNERKKNAIDKVETKIEN